MTYYPSLCKHRPFIAWTDRRAVAKQSTHLQAWQKGKTGYPIVDAAMRQLTALAGCITGYGCYHSQFLVKDLLIDWREGERYFMSQRD